MSARLGNTSSSNMVVVLINGVLHLFQELINVDQVVLGPNIAHGRQLVLERMRTAAVTTTASPSSPTTTSSGHGHGSRHGLVVRDGASTQDWELQVLQAKKPLADCSVGVGVKLTTFQVAKELVEGIIATLLGLVRSLAGIGALVQGIVDIAIRGVWRLGSMWLIVLCGSGDIALTRDRVQRLKVMGTGGIACRARGKIAKSVSSKRDINKHPYAGRSRETNLWRVQGTSYQGSSY